MATGTLVHSLGSMNLSPMIHLQKCIRYNICAAKIHIFFHISIKIIRKLFNMLTI